MSTAKAVLHDNQAEWIEQPSEKSDAAQVDISCPEEPVSEPSSKRGRIMAELLAELSRNGTFAAIADPVAWQRELRSERLLPDREA